MSDLSKLLSEFDLCIKDGKILAKLVKNFKNKSLEKIEDISEALNGCVVKGFVVFRKDLILIKVEEIFKEEDVELVEKEEQEEEVEETKSEIAELSKPSKGGGEWLVREEDSKLRLFYRHPKTSTFTPIVSLDIRKVEEFVGMLPNYADAEIIDRTLRKAGLDGLLRTNKGIVLEYIAKKYCLIFWKEGGSYRICKPEYFDEHKLKRFDYKVENGDVVFDVNGKVYEFTWEQMIEIFENMPDNIKISDVLKFLIRKHGIDDYELAMAIMNFFDERLEFEARLQGNILIKTEYSLDEDVRQKLAMERELLKDVNLAD